MKLAFVVYDLHLKGGGERVASNISNHFSKKPGYQVTIISITERDSREIYALNPEITVKYIGVTRNNGLLSKMLNRLNSIFAVREFFRLNYDFDIVLGIGTHPNVLLTFIEHRRNFRIVACEHGSYNAVPFLWRILKRMRYKRFDALVSLTQKDLPLLRRLNSYSVVIPNSTPIRPDQPAVLSNKRILAVGRLSHEKGYDYLIEVFSKFAKLNNDWNLKILGDGPLQSKIQNLIAEKSLSDRIELAKSANNMLEEYQSASIYILTSRNEGLPMAMIEAQSCGLPIVAFDIDTGPSDIITHQKNGFLVEKFNIGKMVEALLTLSDNVEMRREFGLQGYISSEKFSGESVYHLWEDLFGELKQGKKLLS